MFRGDDPVTTLEQYTIGHLSLKAFKNRVLTVQFWRHLFYTFVSIFLFSKLNFFPYQDSIVM